MDFLIDGTERPVQRPTDALEQKEQYSGEKKHTLKNNLIIDIEECLVRYLSDTDPGRASIMASSTLSDRVSEE